ncbi:DSK1 [Symbiodinium sp. CCMP2456]|nr:DSK1 [Symbiodinium sp. CCMP2456]
MPMEGNASSSGGFDPPGRYFAGRSSAASEPGPEPTPSLRPAESVVSDDSDPGSQAPVASCPVASGLGFVLASPAFASSSQSPVPTPGSWAAVGDVSSRTELVDQLSRLRPDARDRIARLCMRMGSPPGPGPAAVKPKSLFPLAGPAVHTPKSSFPPATPAPTVPEIRAPPAPLDELGFPPEVTSVDCAALASGIMAPASRLDDPAALADFLSSISAPDTLADAVKSAGFHTLGALAFALSDPSDSDEVMRFIRVILKIPDGDATATFRPDVSCLRRTVLEACSIAPPRAASAAAPSQLPTVYYCAFRVDFEQTYGG